MSQPTILLFGANGQLGWELRRVLATLGRVESAGRQGADHLLDVTDVEAVTRLADRLQPSLMVNAAAYTAVDKAESEPDLARRVNADAVAHMGAVAEEIGCPLLHYSTDYVFSGQRTRPWREDDEPQPVSAYGRTKLEGEQRLAASGADHLILRLAWVYAARGHNFLLTMKRLMQQRKEIGVVSDQIGSPSWARQIAEASGQILAQCRIKGGFAFGERGGVYHLAAAGRASWYQFAVAIQQGLGLPCEVQPITTRDYPTPAKRPVWSVLDCERVANTFGVRLPHWRQGLADCLEELPVSS